MFSNHQLLQSHCLKSEEEFTFVITIPFISSFCKFSAQNSEKKENTALKNDIKQASNARCWPILVFFEVLKDLL